MTAALTAAQRIGQQGQQAAGPQGGGLLALLAYALRGGQGGGHLGLATRRFSAIATQHHSAMAEKRRVARPR
ncbi:hypothetical protein MAHJHV63_49860 [Mycobacterium avium subsp. hominissuis]